MARWDAFISYSSADATAAGRVQRFIERYRLPRKRRLRVYRDETDITGGELPAQLRHAIAESGCLIVCCSRAAAQSHWVSLEIETFRERNPGRPIVPVLVAVEPPDNLPAALGSDPVRWADLRAGWRLGLPKRRTRVELVRVIAAVAGIDFRDLLPLDRRRRRQAMVKAASAVAAVLFAAAWVPVPHWAEVTPENAAQFHCDSLDDGIAYFVTNEPQAIKNIVNVRRSVFGPEAPEGPLDSSVIPRGRLLPVGVASALDARCGREDAAWIGEPASGTCVAVRRSSEQGSFDDPMGGVEASLTDVIVGNGEPVVLDALWPGVDRARWSKYGRSVTPSAGLPVSAVAQEIWLGFPDNQFTRGELWHSADGGRNWTAAPDVTDVRSVRQLEVGLVVAARLKRELGFWVLREGEFVPFEVPGKGDDLEVCGEVEGQPVVRADRSAFRLVRRPWWRTRFE